jgi:hypothetical protein
VPAAKIRRRRCLALALAITAPLLTAAGGERVDRLVADFDLIAFNTEFGTPMDGKVHKWTQSLRVFLDIRAGPAELQRRYTVDHARLLHRLTGLDIGFSAKVAGANVVIVFDTADRLIGSVNRYLDRPIGDWKELHGSLCFGLYTVDGGREISFAVIGIPSDMVLSLGKLQDCVIEEFTQILGLPNDSDRVYPSVFNDHSPQVTLTDDDETLVRLLYHPRLTPGMPRAQALKEVRAILEKGEL